MITQGVGAGGRGMMATSDTASRRTDNWILTWCRQKLLSEKWKENSQIFNEDFYLPLYLPLWLGVNTCTVCSLGQQYRVQVYFLVAKKKQIIKAVAYKLFIVYFLAGVCDNGGRSLALNSQSILKNRRSYRDVVFVYEPNGAHGASPPPPIVKKAPCQGWVRAVRWKYVQKRNLVTLTL